MSLFLVHKSPIKIDANGRTSYLLRDIRKTFSNQKRSMNRASLRALGILAWDPHVKVIRVEREGIRRRWLYQLVLKIVGNIGNCAISP